jgi:hypothetical protein
MPLQYLDKTKGKKKGNFTLLVFELHDKILFFTSTKLKKKNLLFVVFSEVSYWMVYTTFGEDCQSY